MSWIWLYIRYWGGSILDGDACAISIIVSFLLLRIRVCVLVQCIVSGLVFISSWTLTLVRSHLVITRLLLTITIVLISLRCLSFLCAVSNLLGYSHAFWILPFIKFHFKVLRLNQGLLAVVLILMVIVKHFIC